MSNKKKNETNILGKLSCSKRNVRRNLNFTKIPVPAIKIGMPVTSRNDLNDNLKEENSHLSTRKSCLLPPNTVKDLYNKNKSKQSKSMLPQTCISGYSMCDNKYLRISEETKSCPSSVRVANARINSAIHKKVNKTVIQRMSSQMFTVNDQSGIDILHSDCTDSKNDAVRKEIPDDSLNVKEKKCLSTTTNNYRQDLHQSIQDIHIINQSLNLNHSINKNDEYVIRKTNLTVLASELKHSICKLEKDILPNLRFMFTTIMDILSTINITDEVSDNTTIMQQMTENLNDHIKINNINTKSLCMISNINTEDNINVQENLNIEESINLENNIPKEIHKTPDTNLIKFVKINACEKNNSKIQTSYQMDLTSDSNKENDSFVDLENKLDITNIKSNTMIVSLKKSIPESSKYKNKKEETPLKEYMALKSRMSCLLTPNIKHFNCSQSKNDDLYSESGDAKACLSGKVLAELYNLYED